MDIEWKNAIDFLVRKRSKRKHIAPKRVPIAGLNAIKRSDKNLD